MCYLRMKHDFLGHLFNEIYNNFLLKGVCMNRAYFALLECVFNYFLSSLVFEIIEPKVVLPCDFYNQLSGFKYI